jgi:long-subunit acyl-CoA synthetase (AMP-forming)
MIRRDFETIIDALVRHGTHRIELSEAGGMRTKTFAELHRDVLALAAYLRGLGIGPGGRVGIRFDNEYAWIVLDLACLVMGAVSVPFHTDLPGFELTEAFRRFRLGALFDATSVHVATGGGISARPRPSIDTLPDGDGIEPAAWEPSSVFTLQFTSGTTGIPKAIELRMKSVTDFLVNVGGMFELRSDDKAIVFMPLSHFGQRSYVYAAILFGFDVALVPPSNLTAGLRLHRPTVMVAVPLFFDGLYSTFKDVGATAVSRFLGGAMRLMVTGSAPMRREVLEFFARIGMPVYEGYGTTETGLITLNHPGAWRIGSVGRPFPNKEVVISPEGEVLVRGEYCWASRYLDAPESTNQAVFRADGFIRTGDAGHFDADGFLYLTGRISELLVLSNGKKAHPFEIETCLRTNSAVQQACAFAHDDTVRAVVVANAASSDQDVATAIAATNTVLPDYARVTSYVVTREPFSVDNGLLTSSLKLNRPRVIERFASGFAGSATRRE